ncbi:MAG TPA: DUF5522 domain-containing protein [Saprospiraceae bacterium]|nr:DUF5522 domain-containing protein [Saprospiraceae bacterium]
MMHRSLQKEDYYYNEDGLLVFTAQFHLKRGYCCGNACKHCPYGQIAVPDEKKRQSTGRLNSGSSNDKHKKDSSD